MGPGNDATANGRTCRL